MTAINQIADELQKDLDSYYLDLLYFYRYDAQKATKEYNRVSAGILEILK